MEDFRLAVNSFLYGTADGAHFFAQSEASSAFFAPDPFSQSLIAILPNVLMAITLSVIPGPAFRSMSCMSSHEVILLSLCLSASRLILKRSIPSSLAVCCIRLFCPFVFLTLLRWRSEADMAKLSLSLSRMAEAGGGL